MKSTRGGMTMRMRAMRSGLMALAGALLAVLSMGRAGHAFSPVEIHGGSTVEEIFQGAAIWSSIFGLSDGIQVGVEPGFATEFGATGSQVDDVNQAIADAFAAWENSVLQFDITFDAPGVVEGSDSGFEIDVFAAPSTHPIFEGMNYYGLADVDTYYTDRPLTNGQWYPGLVISGADIFINIDLVLFVSAVFEWDWSEQVTAGQRLLTHEIGHTIGLGHPNSNDPYGVVTNYDTDNDPFNVMVIDPADPFGDLIVSPNRDDTAIMSNRPCGEPLTAPCPALFYTSLQNDDLGGRDVFYSIPEPGTLLLLFSGVAVLAAYGRHEQGR